MKRTVEKVVEICDFCQEQEAWSVSYKCRSCGKVACYDCGKRVGTEFPHAVFFSGSDDGFYCVPCQTAPSPASAPLLRAYREIQAIRAHFKAREVEDKTRIDAAEGEVRRLLGLFDARTSASGGR